MHQMIQCAYHGVYRQRRLRSRDLPSMRAVTFWHAARDDESVVADFPRARGTLLSRAFLSTTARLLRAGKLHLDT